MPNRISLSVSLCFLLAVLCGCGEDLGAGASIVSLSVTPSTIKQTDSGMTDEFFTVTIVTSGFEDEIDPELTRVFVQDPEIDAVPGTAELNGSTITLDRIAKTWLGGLAPDVYSVGAEVRSDTESVTQRDLATITIEE